MRHARCLIAEPTARQRSPSGCLHDGPHVVPLGKDGVDEVVEGGGIEALIPHDRKVVRVKAWQRERLVDTDLGNGDISCQGCGTAPFCEQAL